MSDTGEISLGMLGGLLRQVQADVRSLRSEQGILRKQVGDAVTALLDRIGQSDAELMTRLDRMETRLLQRLDQTERSVEERLARLEGRP